MSAKSLNIVTRIAILTAFYFVGGWIGQKAAFMGGTVTLAWPTFGIGMAAILLLGYRFWPGVACGAALFAVMNTTAPLLSGAGPLIFIIGSAIGNTIGAMVCAYLLQRFVGFNTSMERVRDVAGFVGLACILGSTVTAAFTAVAICYSGLSWENLFPEFIVWWVPNAIAGLVVAPVILTWGAPSFLQWTKGMVAEALICGVGLAGGTWLSFNSWYAYGIQNYPLAYLPYPFLVWGALRFGQRGATSGTFLVSFLSVYALLKGRGPFYSHNETDSLMLIGSYIGILAVTNMLLAAAATERKVAEDAARKSEAMFLLISENVGDMIAVTDANGKRLYNSPYYTKLFGAGDRIPGSDAFEEIHPEDREKVKRVFEETIRTGVGQRIEFRFVLKDGSVRFIESLGNYVRGGRGQLDKVVSIARDITDRKRDEAALAKSEQLWRTVFAAANDAILILDDSYNVLACNQMAVRMYGYEESKLVGMNMLNLHARNVQENMESQMLDAIRQQGMRWETTHQREDGSTFPVEISSKPLVAAGTQQVVQIVRDITERKQIEADLAKARDAALTAAKQKAEFLANMSHEIRTPMNGIIGMTNLLLRTDLTPVQRDYTATIRTSSDILLTIINDILDFSKIEAGKLTFEILDFDLRDAVESTLELLATRAHSKKIELAAIIQPDVPTLLRADSTRLTQILTNLVGNAIKFTERGEVTVKVSKQEETGENVLLRFEVKDTGIGIPPEAQKRLFQSFSQADGSTTRKYGGTGLGLAISKQLTYLMHGQIGVESTAGAGSTFWFTLLLEKQKEPSSDTTYARINFNTSRILVVDDNATNRVLVQNHLAHWRIPGEAVEGGPQALQALRTAAGMGQPFQVAILDMQMPEMDGLTLARQIKADPAIASTRLLLLSSMEMPMDEGWLKDTGIEQCLNKPIRQSRLFNSIVKLLTPESAVDAAVVKPAESGVKPTEMKKARILLAEDNLINQKVAIGELEHLGYTADAVSNGLEVLQALKHATYDIIFMDCQMPEMDGFQATRRIREIERESGDGRHIHIIAMTANAMQGDREACLAVGMDNYLSKPVEEDDLRAALEGWEKIAAAKAAALEAAKAAAAAAAAAQAAMQAAGAPMAGAAPKPAELPAVDLKRLRRLNGNDSAKTKELINLYLKQADDIIEQLERAIAADSAKDVMQHAHKLAGASATCGMAAIVQPLRQLELIGREGHLNGAQGMLADSRNQLNRIKQYLDEQAHAV